MTEPSADVGRARQTAESEAVVAAQAAIRVANLNLLEKTRDRFELPIAILVEQRDLAIEQAEALRVLGRSERAKLLAEQDQFITFLMTDHEAKLVKLDDELKSTREVLARKRALDGQSVDSASDGAGDVAESETEVGRLKALLEAAYSEADETRADAARLQADLDDAVRAADDVRLEVRQEVDAARDDAFRIQTQLDETNRLLEDARDQTRDEAFRFAEELNEARRDLDERVAEVRRLRERLSDLDASRNSLPPPPAAGAELDTARTDNQLLRKQLIEAKRELSRVARELELSNTRRVARRPTPVER